MPQVLILMGSDSDAPVMQVSTARMQSQAWSYLPALNTDGMHPYDQGYGLRGDASQVTALITSARYQVRRENAPLHLTVTAANAGVTAAC